MTETSDFRNPYVGPRSFDVDERSIFFGRDEEIAILVGQVMARRVSLFFAQSGAGKSSLLRAGLIPELTREIEVGQGRRRHTYRKMRVLPILRVSGGGMPPENARANPYICQALLRLLPSADPVTLADVDFVDALAARLAGPPVEAVDTDTAATDDPAADTPHDLLPPALLIFDQFEEIFHDVALSEARVEFFRTITRAVERLPDLNVLFTMREDYIAELVPYAHLLPDELRHRYRMERLKAPAALAAVKEPAAGAGRPYAPGVAEALVDNLRRTRTRVASTTGGNGDAPGHAVTLGDYVEPVHLQIVCHQLWESLPPESTRIEAGDVQAFGDVDQALMDFYTRAVNLTVAQSGVSERRVRDWFSHNLITPAQTRGLVYRGATETEGLPNRAVDLLRDAYIIRADLRGEDVWYQLAHDRLVEPILTANRIWLESYENPLAAPTMRWLAAGRNPDLLLRDASLDNARRFAAANDDDLTEDERTFLSESTREQARAEHEAAAASRRRRIWTISAIATIVVLLGLSILAFNYARMSDANARAAAANAERARQNEERANEQAELAQEQRDLAQQETQRAQRNEERANEQAERARRNEERANTQARLARSRELASAAVASLTVDPERSILLALSALDTDFTAEAQNALHQAVQTSRVIHTLPEHDAIVSSVLFTPDGAKLVTAGFDGRVMIWDAATFDRLQTIDIGAQITATVNVDANMEQQMAPEERKLDQVYALDISPDGTRLATGNEDGSITLIDVATGTVQTVLRGHTERVLDVAFSPDGTLLASAGADERALLWDLAAGLEIYALEGHTNNVMGIDFSPDGARIATASEDRSVRIWDVASGTEITALTDHGDTVNDVAFSPDGRWLATASWDNTARIYDAETLQPQFTLTGHTNWVRAVRFSRDSSRLATTSYDGTIIVWDVAGARRLYTLAGHRKWIDGVDFSPDGTRLASASGDETARVWRGGITAEVATITDHRDWIMALSMDAAGKQLAVGDRSGRVTIWDTATFSKTHDFQAHETERFNDLALNGPGTLLATAGNDRVVRIWDVATEELLFTLTGHRTPVLGVAFSPDGTELATAGADEQIILWSVADGAQLARYPNIHSRYINSVAFSPDGARGISASVDWTAKIWDAKSGAVAATLNAHGDWVYDAVFSHDGRLAATAGADGIARIWDAQTGVVLQALAGHLDDVTAVAFSADDTMLATASRDGAAMLWDVATGELMMTLTGHKGQLRDVLFSPDGTMLFTASEDMTVRVYALELDALIDLARRRITRTLTPDECKLYLLPEDCGARGIQPLVAP
ncbi:MAG: hypothetical protein KDE20_03230 [Caldilineaceae bacterium]|nr:hypothetical protein [Caldilineaceae bacterium]